MKKLLAATALTLILSSMAYAQDDTPPTVTPGSTHQQTTDANVTSNDPAEVAGKVPDDATAAGDVGNGQTGGVLSDAAKEDDKQAQQDETPDPGPLGPVMPLLPEIPRGTANTQTVELPRADGRCWFALRTEVQVDATHIDYHFTWLRPCDQLEDPAAFVQRLIGVIDLGGADAGDIGAGVPTGHSVLEDADTEEHHAEHHPDRTSQPDATPTEIRHPATPGAGSTTPLAPSTPKQSENMHPALPSKPVEPPKTTTPSTSNSPQRSSAPRVATEDARSTLTATRKVTIAPKTSPITAVHLNDATKTRALSSAPVATAAHIVPTTATSSTLGRHGGLLGPTTLNASRQMSPTRSMISSKPDVTTSHVLASHLPTARTPDLRAPSMASLGPMKMAAVHAPSIAAPARMASIVTPRMPSFASPRMGSILLRR